MKRVFYFILGAAATLGAILLLSRRSPTEEDHATWRTDPFPDHVGPKDRLIEKREDLADVPLEPRSSKHTLH